MGPAFVAWMDAKCPRVLRVIKFRYCLQRAFCSAFRTLRGFEISKIDVRLPAADWMKLARWVAQRRAHFAYPHPPRSRLPGQAIGASFEPAGMEMKLPQRFALPGIGFFDVAAIALARPVFGRRAG